MEGKKIRINRNNSINLSKFLYNIQIKFIVNNIYCKILEVNIIIYLSLKYKCNICINFV